MQIIFFFYGLAFIVMGTVIFSMPKSNDFFEIYDDLWLLGTFGVLHGLNEWVDLLILRSDPQFAGILIACGAVLLPVSFLFLAAFGGSVLSKRSRQFKYLKYIWIVLFAVWAVSSAASNSVRISGIFARYILCLPGAIVSAAGLSMAMTGCRDRGTPKAICLSSQIAVAALISYGILSGLVTPKADFFPASFSNYDSFTMHIGIPVQLFRMLFAIILTLSFIFMTSIFRRTDIVSIKTGGIRRKASFAITATAIIAIIFSASIIFIASFFMIRGSAGREQLEITKTLATTAAENIKNELLDVQTYASRHLWKRACMTANQKYAGMDRSQIEKLMLEADKIWVSARDGDDLIAAHTSGEIPDSMRELEAIRGSLSEIFITDKFGGLIYSSERTSDFYQADEIWWQKAFNDGSGAIYFGGIEYDDSSGCWGLPIAAPIVGPNGEVLGICKAFVKIDNVTSVISDFKLGRTGHAMLIDTNGMILVHKGIRPFSMKIFSLKDLNRIKDAATGCIVTENKTTTSTRSLTTTSQVYLSPILPTGIEWYVMIARDVDDAMGLLNKFLILFLLITISLLGITIPIGLFIGGRISKPIDKLSAFASLIAAGDLDQKITIHTGDEIEQFSEIFKNMIFAIKASQNNLLKAKDKLEQLTKNQEAIIEDRTGELSRSQEATLNILEDLVEAKGKLEKYTKDLEEALRVKTDFTATVSHELRTPLAAIKEGIAIVLDGTAGPIEGRQKEFLEIAKRNVDRLTRLINDLLDFQKMESGRMEYDITENDINAVTKEAADVLSAVAEGKGLKLKFNLDKDLPMIMFDKGRIGQVLTNLIGNAIRYTDTGSITLRTEKENNFVKVSIEDTGIGIKKYDMAKLFQRFSQLEPVSDRRVGGTGLGLAISKEIIDRHKGKIIVDSKPGIGSVFSFFLPIQEKRGAV